MDTMSSSRPPASMSTSSDDLPATLPWEAIGPHRYSIASDVIFLRTEGAIDEEQMALLMSLLMDQAKETGTVLLLIDASRGLTLTAGARRYYGEWGRAHGFQPGSTAVIGAGAATRTILTLITHGIGMFLRQVPPLRFFKRRSEALSWLHSERARWRSVLATPT
jgi:hypothetical protein